MKPTAAFRTVPLDFQVEEIPMYPALGHGAHVMLRVRKTGITTPACARRIADAIGADERDVGHAGMKDRHAVTVQALSIPYPEDRELEAIPKSVGEDIEILEAVRHPHKLRVGHLLGNRFRIVLRELGPGDAELINVGLQELTRRGVPNHFGPQRFGRDGDNPSFALSWLRGEVRPPRDKRIRRLLMSSVQSLLFDRLLQRRVDDGTWNRVLPGDLVKTHDRGGLFLSEDAVADDERAVRGEVSATGPIFGARMRWPSGAPEALEREVLCEALGSVEALDPWAKLGAGSRRALRVLPEEMSIEPDSSNNGSILTVSFRLSKGAYATTVLASVCELHDASNAVGVASKAPDDSSSHDEFERDTSPSSR